MAQGGPEQVPGWLMRHTGGAGQPMGHLDLRFLMRLEHLSIWIYVFHINFCPRAFSLDACSEIVHGRVRVDPWVMVFLSVLGCGWGTI